MKRPIVALLQGASLVIVVLVFVIGISGCQKQEGSMEKAGKKADEAVEATKTAVDNAEKKVGEGAEAAKDAVKKGVEDAAKAVKDTASNVEEKAKK